MTEFFVRTKSHKDDKVAIIVAKDRTEAREIFRRQYGYTRRKQIFVCPADWIFN